jgi:hypothetical protein
MGMGSMVTGEVVGVVESAASATVTFSRPSSATIIQRIVGIYLFIS